MKAIWTQAQNKRIEVIIIGKSNLDSQHSDLKGRIYMGAHKRLSRSKTRTTITNPHFTEFDTQKERNIQKPLPRMANPTPYLNKDNG